MSNKPVVMCKRCLRLEKTYKKPANGVSTWKPSPATCKECRRCDNCGCVCVKCTRKGCNVRVPQESARYCQFCARCKSCCGCRSMPHWVAPEKLGILGTTTKINTLPRAIGVELEIADWGALTNRRFKHLKYITAHDSSVKPSETEMVLTPMYGDAYLTGMVELAEGLYACRSTVNDTCALHAHVNATDLSYWEIRRLLEVYGRIEPDVFKYLVAPYRSQKPESVHYCQLLTGQHQVCAKCERYDSMYPGQRQSLETLDRVLARMRLAKSTSDLKIALIRMLYGIDDPSVSPTNYHHRKGGKYEWCRYRGLNLHSWLYRGTVEWRMKEATTDVEELVYWPLWCGWVVHAVTKMSDAMSRSDGMDLMYLTKKYMPKYLVEWVEKRYAAVQV